MMKIIECTKCDWRGQPGDTVIKHGECTCQKCGNSMFRNYPRLRIAKKRVRANGHAIK